MYKLMCIFLLLSGSMLESGYTLTSPGDSAPELWRSTNSPVPLGRCDVIAGEDSPVSPLCAEPVMNCLTFPPLEFDSLPTSFLSSSYRSAQFHVSTLYFPYSAGQFNLMFLRI